jgi:hypothetical protein
MTLCCALNDCGNLQVPLGSFDLRQIGPCPWLSTIDLLERSNWRLYKLSDYCSKMTPLRTSMGTMLILRLQLWIKQLLIMSKRPCKHRIRPINKHPSTELVKCYWRNRSLGRKQKPFYMSVEASVQRMIKINKYIGLGPGLERQYDCAEILSKHVWAHGLPN